jgi:predicted O-linked N-acetylglucosamine transferase (SPINDLY family)
MATLAQALAVALAHHQAGRLELAAEVYRRVLAVEPEQPDALHLLGVIAHQSGRHAEAVERIEQAIAVQPSEAAFHTNLGEAYRALGAADQAVACYRRALALEPDGFEARSNLGIVLAGQGQHDEAMTCFRQALVIRPDHAASLCNLGTLSKVAGNVDQAIACLRRAIQLDPRLADAHNSLGNALKHRGQLDEAEACFRRAIEITPTFVEAHNNLGNTLGVLGRLDEAVACYQRAIELKPDSAEAYGNLGNARKDQGRLAEAEACYGRALQLDPSLAEVHSNFGNVLAQLGKPDAAVTCHRRAIELRPEFATAHSNLGTVYKDQGQLDRALACYRRALELAPEFVEAHNNLVYTLMFCADVDQPTILEEHRRWSQQHAARLSAGVARHANDRSPDRRLRIGYVSPDLRSHAVGLFMLPLLESHDHQQFEVFCYFTGQHRDRVTDYCQRQADVWRETFRLSDEQLADLVRRDQIDILVDLTMHMSGSRLLTFARKPAPVQVTYLAYCGTTGLEAIDYRLTDPYLDPPGGDEALYVEQSIRLPTTYWCYRPIVDAPPSGAIPAGATGSITFGCLNNFCKVTEPTLACWGQLLARLPDARLLLHAHEGEHRDRVRQRLAEQGVDPARIEFVGYIPTEDYFRVYQRIDIALDPFPYGGGTTTCDALWMGVPVVSLAGRTAVGRSGLSILSNLGLPELVARDESQYQRIALELAADRPRLERLRATLRQRMQTSPLMDAPRFAAAVEAAYRRMWHAWTSGEW